MAPDLRTWTPGFGSRISANGAEATALAGTCDKGYRVAHAQSPSGGVSRAPYLTPARGLFGK